MQPLPVVLVLYPAWSGGCSGVVSALTMGIRVPSGLTSRAGTLISRTPLPYLAVTSAASTLARRESRWTGRILARSSCRPLAPRERCRSRDPCKAGHRRPGQPIQSTGCLDVLDALRRIRAVAVIHHLNHPAGLRVCPGTISDLKPAVQLPLVTAAGGGPTCSASSCRLCVMPCDGSRRPSGARQPV